MRHWSLLQLGLALLAISVFCGVCGTADHAYAQKGKGLENIKSGLFSEDKPAEAEGKENTGGQESDIDELNRSINEDDEAGAADGTKPAKPAKKEKMFKTSDGRTITESEMKREKAAAAKKKQQEAEDEAAKKADSAITPDMFGKGWYISVWKMLLIVMLYLLWTYSTDWLSTDAQKFKLGVGFWAPLVYGVFLGGLVLFWIIPIFWVGFPLLLLAYAIPLGCYIVPRNHVVSDADQVLTWGHFRFLFSELMALCGIRIAPPKDPFESGWPAVLYSYDETNKVEMQQRMIRAHAAPGFQNLREIISELMDRFPDALMLEFNGSSVSTKFQVDGVWIPGKRFEGAKSNPAWMAMKCLLGIDKASQAAKEKEKKGDAEGAEAEEATSKKKKVQTSMFRLVYHYDYTYPEDRLKVKEAMDKLASIPPKEKAARKDAEREVQIAKESIHKPEKRQREVLVNVTVQSGKSADRFTCVFVGEKSKLPDLTAAGMPEEQQAELKTLTSTKNGVILISAPPEGGLRTTTKLVLRRMDRYMREFLEISDGVHKYEEIENIGVVTCKSKDIDEWENFVRKDVLFKEPNVIVCRDLPFPDITDQLLREMDSEERLLVTTNRSRDCAEAILRLLMTRCDLEKMVERLQGVLCVRLVRRICPHCRHPYTPDANLVEKLGLPENSYTFYRPPVPTPGKKHEVCQECRGVGYHGRFALFELVTIGDVTRKVLLSSKPTLELVRKALRKDGNKTFTERGAVMVAQGMTSIEELKRAMAPPKKEGEADSENNGGEE